MARRERAAYSYRGLADFLQLFWQGCTVVHTREDLRDLAHNYLTRASREGVRRAEVFFSPQNFLDRIQLGDQLEAVTSAFDDARSDLSIEPELIVVAQRHRYQALTDALNLTDNEVISLVRSGFTSSFAEPDAIAAALADLDAAAAASGIQLPEHDIEGRTS